MDGVPARLGRYRLLRQLAVGGMAEVYLAVAEGLGDFAKRVVIKRMLPQHAREQDLVAMFVDEARLLARLRHPNIAEVYDIGQDGQDIFIALEHVDGSDLREVLRAATGGLPFPEALWVVCELCAGLHHAHELAEDAPDGTRRPLGIVHRDVSPSNVLCARDGQVKLIDFGVAKWSAQRSETRHGTVKGKLHYLSPEQCRSGAVDRRSDIFAVGVLLYELTTGQRPFGGSNDFDVLAAVMEGRCAPPSRLRAGYPAQLEAIVQRALAPAPEARYPDALALADALRAFAATHGVELGPAALAARVRETRARAPEAAPDGAVVAQVSADLQAARAAALAPAAASGGDERTRTALPGASSAPAAEPPPARDGRTRTGSGLRRRRRLGWLIAGAATAVVLAAAVVSALAGRPAPMAPEASRAAAPLGSATGARPRGAEPGAGARPAVPSAAPTAAAWPDAPDVGPTASLAAAQPRRRAAVPGEQPRLPARTRREDGGAAGQPGAVPSAGSGEEPGRAAPPVPASGSAQGDRVEAVAPAHVESAAPSRPKVWDPDSPIPP